jgi:hypothetical protein
MHKFNLIENAKDSLVHAIKHMGPVDSNSHGDWKRIIVDLAHVLELLFKERLRQIHPAFVFSDIDKYPSSNAFTVGAKLAIKRLENVGHISFSKDDLKAITSAREKRNEIEHYEFTLENQEAKVLVGQVLAFILRFSENELKLEWNSLCFEGNKWYVLRQYKEFYESLLNSTNDRIEAEEIAVIECPSCHNETFDIEQEYCLLCGHQEEILECERCKAPYLYSTVEYEEAGLCVQCEWEDGYAAANFEKY